MKIEYLVKILLAVLFFMCVLDMPYGFYQFVRLAALIGFVVLAYQANISNKQVEMICYVGLAILFQPIIKVALGRQIWNIVDVIVGVGLLLSIFIKPRISKQ